MLRLIVLNCSMGRGLVLGLETDLLESSSDAIVVIEGRSEAYAAALRRLL